MELGMFLCPNLFILFSVFVISCLGVVKCLFRTITYVPSSKLQANLPKSSETSIYHIFISFLFVSSKKSVTFVSSKAVSKGSVSQRPMLADEKGIG